MEGVRLQTSQNVTIDQEIAGIGDRMVATLIDYLAFAGYFLSISFIARQAEWYFLFSNFGYLILLLPVFLYDLLCEVFLEGKNIGKGIMKTQVVKLDGSSPTLSDYLLRWILRIVDFLPVYWAVGTVTILVNGKGQRVGDIAAGTTVIKTQRKTDLNDTILHWMDADHQVVFPQVRKLTDKDISTVLDILHLARKNNNPKLLRPLAKKIRKTLEVNPRMNDRPFLETILKDYANLERGD